MTSHQRIDNYSKIINDLSKFTYNCRVSSTNQEMLWKIWQFFAVNLTDLFKLLTQKFTHVVRSYLLLETLKRTIRYKNLRVSL